MKITFLGGADEVGASSLLIEIGGRRLLVDAGIRPTPKARWGLAGDQLPDLSQIEESGGIDAILVTHAHTDHTGALEFVTERYPGIPVYATPVFSAELASTSIVEWTDGALRKRPLGDLVGRRVVTVSGIAEPRSFYEALGALEIQAVEVLEYPDHHRFTTSDWQRINHAARRADLVVCTEKDLVKLRRFPFARGRLVALRVDFALAPSDEERLYQLVLERLRPSDERVNGRAGEVG